MTSQSPASLWQSQLFPLWTSLFLIAVVPFLSIYRVGPLSSFFLESGSLFAVLLFVLLTAFSGSLKQTALPRSTWYFLALAVFWAIQARAMNLVYHGQTDMVAWSFVILALACWAARAWVWQIGLERAVSVLAAVLLIGCVAQGIIGWLQYTGWAAQFKGYLMYRTGIVEGQLAQRNHFGHYMMWGVLSAAWLWSQRRLAIYWAVFFVLFFASVMGLTGSRTIFGYVLALAVLLPLWRLLSGSHVTRTTLAFGAAAICVLLLQFAIEPILNLFSGSNLHSAAERMGSSFGGSGRGYEWQKAWQIFLSAPLFGYGWGSYSLHGFLTNVYPTGFRPYEGNVLFTHSHNSFLNLLAEMGLVGTLLVLGGLLWAIHGCLKREHATVGLFLVALMSVSLVHSFVEYPLWYIYFLSVFALFIGFAPPAQVAETVSGSLNTQTKRQWSAIMASILLMAGIVRLGLAYQDLRQVSGSVPTATIKRTENIIGLLTTAKTEPMLRYYAQLQLSDYIDPHDSIIPNWASEHIGETMQFRPYANAYKWALVAERTGNTQEARDWMQLMYRYYPTKFQAYGSALSAEHYRNLHQDYTQACHLYHASIKKLPECVKLSSFQIQTGQGDNVRRVQH
ncbi:MAG: Wzy polymerase domain-containing protein [Alysiella sp.]|uniref:PglL family O-oligosaccharyltransferase n=1 Tax=Alysiella sp. TaxID=1872483 RepID=UPI0026DD03BE|nr:Wzy polymerase domain-containing protein [Alysiella sp.]MDO4433239.1 Wzy polymerase domain-containing protein [Alysiella sp.]